VVNKVSKCPTCGKNSFAEEEKSQHLAFRKMEMVLKSDKTPYEKKIALFECLKKIEVGELTSEQRERIDFLIQSRIYAELAKQSMKEYKKSTVKEYSKKEKQS
jgi:hypothetical protein